MSVDDLEATAHVDLELLAVARGDVGLVRSGAVGVRLGAHDRRTGVLGEERLVKLTRELANHPAHSIQNALLQAVSHHCGGQFQDDATLIVLQRNRD